MAIIQKIFAYNTGSLISGTTQVGDIAISEADVEYSDDFGGLQWWGGPDETNGYVIAHTDPTGGHNGQISTPAYLGFWRSNGLTDQDFLDLCNSIPPRIGDTPFTTTSEASDWLAANGYWTSFTSITPTPTATVEVTTTPTPTPSTTSTPTPSVTNTQTPTTTPTPTGTPSAGSVVNMTLLEVGGDVVLSGEGTMNLTSLTNVQPFFRGSSVVPQASQFGCGLAGPGPFNSRLYTGSTFSSPANFGTGGQTVGSSGTGDFFGVTFAISNNQLFVPSGYTSGSFISGTTTFNSTTLSTLGATPGTYTWSWGSGATLSSIIMTVGAGSVTPTPTSSNTATPTPTPSVTQTQTPSVTPTLTPTTSETPTPTPTSAATAPFSASFVESGSDVVLSFEGTLDLTGLNFSQTTNAVAGGVGPAQAAFGIGPSGTIPVDAYTGGTFSYPSNFGTGGGSPIPTGSGDYFGVFTLDGPSGPKSLIVPSGYTSSTYIAGTTTLSGQTFASLGLSAGTYNYSWGVGAGQSFVLTIGGVGPTPTPTATSVTPTPTPTSGYTGDGWLFYTPEGTIAGPPSANGNTIFLASGVSTFNPNISPMNVFFNTGTTLGTSYLTQFQSLDTLGGTLTVSQGSNTAIYSGTSTSYTLGPGYLQLQISSSTQIVQSASTSFVSGTTINVVVS